MRKSVRVPKKPAAKRRNNAPHGASRGLAVQDRSAPQGRKKLPRTSSNELRLILIPIALEDEIVLGDSLPDKLLASLRRNRLRHTTGDIIIIKHKIVFKSEGRGI